MVDFRRIIAESVSKPGPAPEAESVPDTSKPPEPPEAPEVPEVPEVEPAAPATPYAGWHLQLQKTNAILEIVGDKAPRAAREVLQGPLDQMDLDGYRRALASVTAVARAIARAEVAIEWIRPDNEGLAAALDRALEPGVLESRDERQRFMQTVRVAWGARRQQLGGLFEREIGKSSFELG